MALWNKENSREGVSDKRNSFAGRLRELIVKGEYPPGAQLPTRRELATRFNTTLATMQVVFDRLLEEGFVESSGRSGTFVSKTPPYLNHYGLVFPYQESRSQPWPIFWKAFAQEADRVGRECGRRLTICYGNEGVGQHAVFEKTIEKVRNHHFGGLIFLTPPFLLGDTPLVSMPGLPRVMLCDPMEGIPIPAIISASYPGKVLSYLASHGRKRAAVLTVPELLEPTFVKGLPIVANRAGISLPSYWQQTANPFMPETARRCIQLLMRGSPQERPDGLFIMDDNFVEQATLGMLDAGLKVPEDVLVVAHGNYPLLPKTHVPVTWFGFDIPMILRALIECLDKQCRGEIVEPFQVIEGERIENLM